MEESAADARGSSMSMMLKVLLGQVGAGVLSALVFWGVEGKTAAVSALAGGLICAIPNAFLASRLAFSRRDSGPRALMRAAWLGEAGKLALTVLLFSAAFVLIRPLAAGALFAGFIAAQLVTLGGLLLRDEQQRERRTRHSNGE